MSIQKMEYQELLKELVTIIEKTKIQVISHANSSLTVMFWHVGKKILTHNLQKKSRLRKTNCRYSVTRINNNVW